MSDEVTIALRPISTDEWMKLPKREQQLSAISDVLAYWINWTVAECQAEKFTVKPDTHIVLAGDNAPPHWPSVGQLTHWIMVLRDSDASLAENAKRLSPEGVAARASEGGIAQ